MVTIRVPSDTRRGRRQQETREFRAVRKDLLALADWLRCWGVTRIGMEATGGLLETGVLPARARRLRLRAVPRLPGQGAARGGPRPTSWTPFGWRRSPSAGTCRAASSRRKTSAWLLTHTRYRRHLVQTRTAEKNRCEKLLEDAHLKLSSVISDIHGVSGREMLTAIIAPVRDPKVLAQMARTRMRGKIAQLEEALDCSFFTGQHAFILQMMLANIDHLTAQITELNARIDELCQPYERQIAQLDAIPGFGIITAQDIIGEIGVDMTVFPTVGYRALLGSASPPGQRVRRETQGQERHRPRQSLPRRRPRRGRRQRRPHQHVPGNEIPAAGQAHAQEESPGRHQQKPAGHLLRTAV